MLHKLVSKRSGAAAKLSSTGAYSVAVTMTNAPRDWEFRAQGRRQIGLRRTAKILAVSVHQLQSGRRAHLGRSDAPRATPAPSRMRGVEPRRRQLLSALAPLSGASVAASAPASGAAAPSSSLPAL